MHFSFFYLKRKSLSKASWQVLYLRNLKLYSLCRSVWTQMFGYQFKLKTLCFCQKLLVFQVVFRHVYTYTHSHTAYTIKSEYVSNGNSLPKSLVLCVLCESITFVIYVSKMSLFLQNFCDTELETSFQFHKTLLSMDLSQIFFRQQRNEVWME